MRQRTTALPSLPVTIGDIAKVAGVHPGTVSRALRGIRGKVSPEKRAEIERIAREFGYQPNAVAASLRTKQTNLAAIIVPDIGNPLFGPIVQGLERALHQHKMLCLVVQPAEASDARRNLIAALAGRHVSGLLVLAAESDDPMLLAAKQRHMPTVLINRTSSDATFSSVVNDDHESVRLVLEHLTAMGHVHIAHVAGPSASSTGRARRQAFIDHTRAQGMKYCPIVEANAFTRDAGKLAAEQMLKKRRRPTAIFAANDLIALGVLDAARQHAISVPAQLSVVGHNDMPFADLLSPALTTVHVATDQMSARAASLFIEVLADPAQKTTAVVLTPRLVVRASTAAPG